MTRLVHSHTAESQPEKAAETSQPAQSMPDDGSSHAQEIGGPEGPEPTRYGDWQVKGRVSDF